jgi:dihydroneopterin triphosphate diphosphatase
MNRAPFQILVFPYKLSPDGILYAVFSRSDYDCWQGIAGGGQDSETPLQAAKRETQQEADIPGHCPFLALDTINSIPVIHFKDSHLWGDHIYVIPEYAFGVEVGSIVIQLSHEHKEYRWVSYEQAENMLKYEGNKIALWELNQRLLGNDPRG